MNQMKTSRPRNWLYEFWIILIGAVLIGFWWLILGSARQALVAGAWTYLILAWSTRLIFQKHHRRGMQHLRNQNYLDAVAAFQKSYDFFTKYPAIDKYRFLTMFTSSAFPYRQMALNNMGLCYLYLGQEEKALETFEELAELNPEYTNLKEAIEMIRQHLREKQSIE